MGLRWSVRAPFVVARAEQGDAAVPRTFRPTAAWRPSPRQGVRGDHREATGSASGTPSSERMDGAMTEPQTWEEATQEVASELASFKDGDDWTVDAVLEDVE